MRFICRLLVAITLLYPLAVQSVPQAAKSYQRELIRNGHAVWGLKAPVALFAAQIHQESQWNIRAVSPVGARGLAQFMPKTANWISELYPELADNQSYNPSWALRALVRYDYWLYQHVSARTECDRMAFMLSAYNGGLGWVQKDKRKARVQGLDPQTYWQSVELVNSGRSRANFTENRGYPKRIIYRWQPLYQTWGPLVCL